MNCVRFSGDVKKVCLAIKAIGMFHKTVAEFYERTKNYTDEQKQRYIRLLVAIYKQFNDIPFTRENEIFNER